MKYIRPYLKTQIKATRNRYMSTVHAIFNDDTTAQEKAYLSTELFPLEMQVPDLNEFPELRSAGIARWEQITHNDGVVLWKHVYSYLEYLKGINEFRIKYVTLVDFSNNIFTRGTSGFISKL